MNELIHFAKVILQQGLLNWIKMLLETFDLGTFPYCERMQFAESKTPMRITVAGDILNFCFFFFSIVKNIKNLMDFERL